MNNEICKDRTSLKRTQKKSAQYSGLSFLSAISTPSVLTVLNQTGAPLWFSVGLGFVCMVASVYFFIQSSRMNQMVKARIKATSSMPPQSEDKSSYSRAS